GGRGMPRAGRHDRRDRQRPESRARRDHRRRGRRLRGAGEEGPGRGRRPRFPPIARCHARAHRAGRQGVEHARGRGPGRVRDETRREARHPRRRHAMKAVTFQGVGDVKVEDVADPEIVDPTDVVVRITTSAVCGSDLHQYHGRGGAILSTAYCCAENGGIRPGDVVAVFGAGPVGLLAMQSAQLFGPARVFAVDRVDYRLALAAELGAEPVNVDTSDPAEQVRALTDGRGPDVVLECVGHETPFTQAIQAVRAGGAVSSVGVYVETTMGFQAREAITHTMPLTDTPHGYATLDRKEDRAIKVMLKPRRRADAARAPWCDGCTCWGRG